MSDADPAPWRPSARDDLVFRRVGDEWLLFDPRTQRIHVLNLPSALVWSYCSGEFDPEEIHREVEEAYDEAVPREEIRRILVRFRDEGLLAP